MSTKKRTSTDQLDMGFFFSSTATTILLFLVLLQLLRVAPIQSQLSGPMTCSTINSSCPAYLYYNTDNRSTENLDYVATLFNVSLSQIKEEQDNSMSGAVIVSVTCRCSNNFTYLAEAEYSVKSGGDAASIATDPYENLGNVTGTEQSLVSGEDRLHISLKCGCSTSPRQRLLSYVVHSGDTVGNLATRFNATDHDILQINNISRQDFIGNDVVYYIPVSDADFEPAVSLSLSGSGSNRGGGIAVGTIVGIALAGLLLIAAVAALIFFILMRKLWCYKTSKPPFDCRSTGSSPYDARASPRSSVYKSKRRGWLGFLESLLQCGQDSTLAYNAKHHISTSLSKDMMTGVFGIEKPVIFAYEEVLAATDNFKDSNLLGLGAYGSVYYGILRDQDVAIKKMKASKTKEFLPELKVLCKVHHTNLVELIGYSVSEDELFLVYEYAENNAVSDRLHDPISKNMTPLTWNARVQIALDAAQGLEYIHEHTKAHYVHRDVKTSNILLDGYFRAKVADFGLAKLIEQSSNEDEAPTAVGTFGYLAPECLRDGQATAKSDVYAFGVVIFELITGEEAIPRNNIQSTPDRRSLISIMLSALGDCSTYNVDRVREVVDPLLQDSYPLDTVFKMATLGKQCVEEDPLERPDMKHVVLTLSQLLLTSIEWEATLAGNSQVFSGLIQGR